MSRDEAIKELTELLPEEFLSEYADAIKMGIEALEQMTAEEYRQRMMQAFHNADCGELIAVCVQPTEKEFEHLEWLLKNHYKKEPCDDCISREETLKALMDEWTDFDSELMDYLIKK